MALIFILQMFSRARLPHFDIVTLLINSSSDVGPALSGHSSTVLLADTIWKKVVTLVHNFWKHFFECIIITEDHT